MKDTFGDRLKNLRKEHDLTMDAFIEQINKKYPDILLNKSIISRYENNIHTPKRFTIVENMAEFFDVTVNYMMGKSSSRYEDDIKYKEVKILGSIAAGLPITAQEDILGIEYVIPNDQSDFCLKVKGDSMTGARIFDGDIVFIKRQPMVENGEIAAVQIDGEEVTLKRFYNINGSVMLKSENPNYKDMTFSKKDSKEITILGKVIYFKSEVK